MLFNDLLKKHGYIQNIDFENITEQEFAANRAAFEKAVYESNANYRRPPADGIYENDYAKVVVKEQVRSYDYTDLIVADIKQPKTNVVQLKLVYEPNNWRLRISAYDADGCTIKSYNISRRTMHRFIKRFNYRSKVARESGYLNGWDFIEFAKNALDITDNL